MANFRKAAPIAALAMSLAMASCAARQEIKKTHPLAPPPPPPAPAVTLKSVKPYTVFGVTYYPIADSYGFEQEGTASWYGEDFHGKPTSSGEIYDMNKMTAAHKTLPLGTMVEVTRLDSGGSVVVRVNDRGPFVSDRIIDLSKEAARRLGMLGRGTARVRVVALAAGRPSAGGEPVVEGPPPDFKHGRFWAQVGAFGVRENAERVRERLLFPVNMVLLEPFRTPDGAAVTRVRVGPFSDIDSAQAALSRAVEQGFPGSFVVAD